MKFTAKVKTKLWKAAFVISAVLGLTTYVAADQDFRSLFAEKLADKVPVEQLLGILNEEEQEVGLNVISTSNTGLTNVRIGGVLQRGSSSSTSYYRVDQYDVETWPTNTTTFAIQNTRSSSSTLERLIVDFSGTGNQVASTTFYFSCGTSTRQFVAFDAADPPDALFNDEEVATSTQPLFDSANNRTNDSTTGTLRARSSVLVGPNHYLVCHAQNSITSRGRCPDQSGAGDGCEPVTSTNRGWIANLRLQWGWAEGI